MSVEAYLGNPPANIKAWIEQHSQPSGHSDTRVTYVSHSEREDWSGEIVGALTNESIPYIEDVETVDVGNTVTSIGTDAFRGSSYLTSIIMPDSVTTINPNAFQSCSNLSYVSLGSGIESIEYGAFIWCSGIPDITIPASIEYIDEDAFTMCTSLSSVVFQGKTLEQVQNIENKSGIKKYPWGIEDTSIIHVA